MTSYSHTTEDMQFAQKMVHSGLIGKGHLDRVFAVMHGEEKSHDDNEDMDMNSPYPEVPLSPSPKASKPLSPSKNAEEHESRSGLPR